MRQVWSATVRGFGGQFEQATLEVDDGGRFVLSTSNSTAGSTDRCVIEHDDAVALAEVLEDELQRGSTGG